QFADLARVDVADAAAESRIDGGRVVAAHVVDDPGIRDAVEPLQLRAHLPVPGAGRVHDMEGIALRRIEIADLGLELRRQARVHHGNLKGQHPAVGPVPGRLVVIAKKVMLVLAAEPAARWISCCGHTLYEPTVILAVLMTLSQRAFSLLI